MSRSRTYNRSKRVSSARSQKQLIGIACLALFLLALIVLLELLAPSAVSWLQEEADQAGQTVLEDGVRTARIMAHGDLLYHLPILRWVEQVDGSYDFSENFTYVKPWIEQADFAIADFEGDYFSRYGSVRLSAL